MYDIIVFAAILLWTVPLSKKYNYLSPTIHHIYSICVSTLLTFIAFGWTSVVNTYIMAIVMWGFIKYFSPIKELWKVIFVWIFSLGYLSIVQLYALWYYWLEWNTTGTCVLMVLVIKLTTVTWDIYDFNCESYSKNELKVDKIPSLLEWLGWVFMIPGFMTAPVMRYKEYENFVKRTKGSNIVTFKQRLDYILAATIVAAIYLYGMIIIPFEYVLSTDFMEHSFFYRICYVCTSIFCIKFRYYFAWILAELAYIESGASLYTSHKGKNISIYNVEFGTNVKQVLSNWNICTNEWLKNCIYTRVQSLGGGVFLSIAITNFISAMWHGFYPGYYVAFLFGGIVTYTHRGVRKNISKHFLDKDDSNTRSYKHILYTILSKFVVLLVWSTAGIPFVLYTIPRTFKALGTIYWAGVIVAFLGLIIVYITNVRNMYILERLERKKIE